VFSLKSDVLEFIVSRCSAIKAKIVQQDEREEKGIRTILNFGHTIGHAIEAAGNYKRYNHGEAVALGMLVASDISNLSGLFDIETARRIESLIEKAGLPTKIKRITFSDIINAHYRDKKFIGGKNRFVLIKAIGKTEICRNIPLRIIKAALGLRI
jgi:3-dehydroquinate synthase